MSQLKGPKNKKKRDELAREHAALQEELMELLQVLSLECSDCVGTPMLPNIFLIPL